MQASAKIVTSKSDKREYKHITLPNEMQCLLISDQEAERSAAALDVNVGACLDPRPYYGVAHFLEHMLFMGSKKYPSENEYFEYIKDHGGYSNAYTSLANTNYHFEVSNEYLEGSLDRFVQFFICPLLKEESAEKEINAVDSEFNMGKQADARRVFVMQQDLAHPESQLNRFNTGNIETLKQDGIRDILLNYHKTWYSSNIMKLTVSGKHSIAQLEEWVVKMFSEVENKNVVRPSYCTPIKPYTHENLAKLTRFRPIQDQDRLLIQWILPQCEAEYKSQPLSYLSHLLGHEGENSLLSYLKQEGYAMTLSAGSYHWADMHSDFKVDVKLTKKGLENYEKVAQAVFKYTQRLVEVGPQDYIHDEVKTLGQLNFDFTDKGSAIDYCVNMAKTMQKFESPDDLPHLIRHSYVADDFDKSRVQEMAQLLSQPENCHFFLISQSFDESQMPFKKNWYHFNYSSEKFSAELLQALKQPFVAENGKKLDLPPKNNLLPKSFDILAEDPKLSQVPQLLERWDNAELWYKKDDEFKRPKGIVNLKLYSNDNMTTRTAKGRLFIELWNECLQEFRREFSYMADLANLSFSHTVVAGGIDFQWSGYDSPLSNYIEATLKLMNQMKQADIQSIFADKKEMLLQQYKNHYLQMVFRLGWSAINDSIHDWDTERHALRAILEGYTYQDFQADLSNWMVSGRMIWGFFGNITTQTAVDTVKEARQILNLQVTKPGDLLEFKVVDLQVGEQRINVKVEDPKNENSCFVSYFQLGSVDPRDYKKAQLCNLTAQFLDEPTFNQLRTIEQLGYVVFTRVANFRGVHGLKFLIQSPQKTCSHIRNSFDKHMSQMREKAAQMTDEDFKTMVTAVLVDIEAKDKNLGEQASRFFAGEISNHKYQFNSQQESAAAIRQITKQEWQTTFETMFGEKARRLDMRYTCEAHMDAEACSEFKFEKEVVHNSVAAFKTASQWNIDQLKQRYVDKDFKL